MSAGRVGIPSDGEHASTSAPAAEVAPAVAVHSRNGWPLVLALTVIYTYAYIDRSILTLLVEPIKSDLRVSDTQMSLLLGTAFAALYAVANIPAGYLVDRFSRRAVMGVSTVSWSVMTMICGVAQSYSQLFVARAGVGLAEATVTPASFCLIREEVPTSQRSRAFSVFATGTWIGSACSLLLGAAVISYAAQGAFSGVPGLGMLRPWQIVLVVIGALGIPISLLTLFVPRRPRVDMPSPADLSLGIAFRHMWIHRGTYALLIAFVTLGAMLAFGKGAWLPALLSRRWGLEPSAAGYRLGLMNLTFAPLGMLFGGYVMDRIAERGRDIRRYGLLAAALTMISVGVMPLLPSLMTMLAAHAVGLIFSGVFYVVGAMTLAEITPQEMMGKVTAAYLLLQGTAAQALGPFFIAALADTIFSDQGLMAIAYGMSASSVVIGILSCTALVLLMRRLRLSRPGT